MKHFAKVILVCIFLNGCVSAQLRDTTYYKIRDMDFDKDYNACWQVLLDTLSDENQPITVIEKESGIIVTEFVMIDLSNLLRIASRVPYGIFGTGYTEGRYKLNIRVKRTSPNVTNIKINAHIEGFFGIMQPYGWHPLESRGVLENDILKNVVSKLKVQ